MIEQFTVEEINLMGVFDFANDRAELIAEIMMAAKEFDDPDMIDIGVSVLAKLYKMSDAEFDALELYPEYGDFDEDGDYYEQTEV
ncbi:hypothetical protein FACS1894105_05050 [Clostridia bacterium]|nr:hypothetical protein FACS1894105_05050 [Clostridia bacterium]